MTTYTEGQHRAGFIHSCAPGNRSVENIVVDESQTLVAGAVLGQIKYGTATEDHAGNTGNGAMSGLAVGRNAIVGDYVLTCIAAATNAGRFQVVDPNGVALEDAVVAVAYANNHLAFTIADGAADFVVGDVFTITVPAGTLRYVELDTSGVDGSQVAAGVLMAAVTTAVSTTATEAIVARDAELNLAEITWPTGISDANKAIATADLKAAGIILR